ncbi:MAG TPA: DNA mismatch repair protein MutS [Gemmatimonadaceae bacterium]|nr:DNA mismatch repair protein MutS [Gemmatimonadaceae bacterium]
MSRDATPLMQQYHEIKARHANAILLFRMGDFYEMFYDDAETAARVLGLTLTSRNNGGAAEVPLAGVPVKAVTEYLRRLVQQGFRVAICEQVEDPRLAKGIVRRAVVETVTPGAVFEDELLDGQRHNFLCALCAAGAMLGIAAADVSTGAFRLALVPIDDAAATLARFGPREVLVARGSTGPHTHGVRLNGVLVTEREEWEFDFALAREELSRRFAVHSLEGLGLAPEADPAIGAAGALLRYLGELQPGGIPHLMPPRLEQGSTVMPLDEMTRRNLELVEPLRGDLGDEGHAGTLLSVLDRTRTAMGARLLREWILAPLRQRDGIDDRLAAVAALVHTPVVCATLRGELQEVRDVERLAGKTAAGRATPRDLRALGDSLARLPRIAQVAREAGAGGLLRTVLDSWDTCDDLVGDLQRHLVERPSATLGDGDVIASGVDVQLDEFRALRDGGRDAIAGIQATERSRTGIASLRVGYNRVFGYYIEVTNANRHLIPPDYQRRQTLTGAERYVTPALKEYEEKVLGATERIETRERELFDALRARIGGQVSRLQHAATRVAILDVVAALADVAAGEGYCRPELVESFDLEIVGGRHPVVERMMPRDRFVPNDVRLSPDARMMIVTGPNMAGKSTILRQVGLIVLMAQMGSFVPATRARIGLVDRVFTRVGASDNLARGQSTFMVEMAETSAILHLATRASLVLLDEIGRGTSTYDGVSIAWAVSEHLHDRLGCKTIFATHYHELTQLADELVALRNYNVAVREVGDTIVFLHRLQAGGADRSYGIEVGRLAGLPAAVIARARAVLRLLEGEQLVAGLAQRPEAGPPPSDRVERSAPVGGAQLGLFTAPDPIVERLCAVDVEQTTPLEAIRILGELSAAARARPVQS